MPDPENHLVLMPHWLGDAVLATSILQGLSGTAPHSRITVVGRPDMAGLLAAAPFLEQFVPVVRNAGRSAGWWARHRHWFDVWCQIRGVQRDTVIDLRGTGMGWFLPCRTRVMWQARKAPVGHRVEQYQALAGFPHPFAPRLWLSDTSLERARGLLAERGWLPRQPVLVLAPVANSTHKEWGDQRFLALMHRFLSGRSSPVACVVVGTPGERPRMEGLLKGLGQHPQCLLVDASGGLPLEDVAALVHHGNLFLGNDSGPMHMAAALGIPVLALFGPTSEQVYGPWPVGPGHRVRVLRAAGGERTMEALAVDDVAGALEQMWVWCTEGD